MDKWAFHRSQNVGGDATYAWKSFSFHLRTKKSRGAVVEWSKEKISEKSTYPRFLCQTKEQDSIPVDHGKFESWIASSDNIRPMFVACQYLNNGKGISKKGRYDTLLGFCFDTYYSPHWVVDVDVSVGDGDDHPVVVGARAWDAVHLIKPFVIVSLTI